MLALGRVSKAPVGYGGLHGQGCLIQAEVISCMDLEITDGARKAAERLKSMEDYVQKVADEHKLRMTMGVLGRIPGNSSSAQPETMFGSMVTSKNAIRSYAVCVTPVDAKPVDAAAAAAAAEAAEDALDFRIRQFSSHLTFVGNPSQTLLSAQTIRPLIPYCYSGTFFVTEHNTIIGYDELRSRVTKSTLANRFFLRYILRIDQAVLERIWSRLNIGRIFRSHTSMTPSPGCKVPDTAAAISADATLRLGLYTSVLRALTMFDEASGVCDVGVLSGILVEAAARVGVVTEVALTWPVYRAARKFNSSMRNARKAIVHPKTGNLCTAARLAFNAETVRFFAAPELEELRALFGGQEYLLTGLGVPHLIALHRDLFHNGGRSSKRIATGEGWKASEARVSVAYCYAISELAGQCRSSLVDILPPYLVSAYSKVMPKEVPSNSRAVARSPVAPSDPNGPKECGGGDDYGDDDDDDDWYPDDDADDDYVHANANAYAAADDPGHGDDTDVWADPAFLADVDDAVAAVRQGADDALMLAAAEEAENEHARVRCAEVDTAMDVDWDDFDADVGAVVEQGTASAIPLPPPLPRDFLYHIAREDAEACGRVSAAATIASDEAFGAPLRPGMTVADYVSYPECPTKTSPKNMSHHAATGARLQLELPQFVELAAHPESAITFQEVVDVAVHEQIIAYTKGATGHTCVPYAVLETRMLSMLGVPIQEPAVRALGCVSQETLDAFSSVHESCTKKPKARQTALRSAAELFSISVGCDTAPNLLAHITLAMARLSSFGVLVLVVDNDPLETIHVSDVSSAEDMLLLMRDVLEQVDSCYTTRRVFLRDLFASLMAPFRARMAFSSVYTAASFRHEDTIVKSLANHTRRSTNARHAQLEARGFATAAAALAGQRSIAGCFDLGGSGGGADDGAPPRKLPPAEMRLTPFHKLALDSGWSYAETLSRARVVNDFLAKVKAEEEEAEAKDDRGWTVSNSAAVCDLSAVNAEWVLEKVVYLKGGRRPVSMPAFEPTAEQLLMIRQIENGVPVVNAVGAGGAGKSYALVLVVCMFQPASVLFTSFMYAQVANVSENLTSGEFPFPEVPPGIVTHKLIDAHTRYCLGRGSRLRDKGDVVNPEGGRDIPFFRNADWDISDKPPHWCPLSNVGVILVDEACTMPPELVAGLLEIAASPCCKNLMTIVFLGDTEQLVDFTGGGIGDGLLQGLGGTTFDAQLRSKSAAASLSTTALRYKDEGAFVVETIQASDCIPPKTNGESADDDDIFPVRIIECESVTTSDLPAFSALKDCVDEALVGYKAMMDEAAHRAAPAKRPYSGDVEEHDLAAPAASSFGVTSYKKPVHLHDLDARPSRKIRRLDDIWGAVPAATAGPASHSSGLHPIPVAGGSCFTGSQGPASTLAAGLFGPAAADTANGLTRKISDHYHMPQSEESRDARSKSFDPLSLSPSWEDNDCAREGLLETALNEGDDSAMQSWEDDADTARDSAPVTTAISALGLTMHTGQPSVPGGEDEFFDDGDDGYDNFAYNDHAGALATGGGASAFLGTTATTTSGATNGTSSGRTGAVLREWFYVLIELAARGVIREEHTLVVFQTNKEARLAEKLLKPFFKYGKQSLTSGRYRGELVAFTRNFKGMGITNRMVVRVIAECRFKWAFVPAKAAASLVTPIITAVCDGIFEAIENACRRTSDGDDGSGNGVNVTKLRTLLLARSDDDSQERRRNPHRALVDDIVDLLLATVGNVCRDYGLDATEMMRLFMVHSSFDHCPDSHSPLLIFFVSSPLLTKTIKQSNNVPPNIVAYLNSVRTLKLKQLREETGARAETITDATCGAASDETIVLALFCSVVGGVVRRVGEIETQSFNKRCTIGKDDITRYQEAPLDSAAFRVATSSVEVEERGGALRFPIKRNALRDAVTRAITVHNSAALAIDRKCYLGATCNQMLRSASKNITSLTTIRGENGGPRISEQDIYTTLVVRAKGTGTVLHVPHSPSVEDCTRSPSCRTGHAAQSQDQQNVFVVPGSNSMFTHSFFYTALTRGKCLYTVLGSKERVCSVFGCARGKKLLCDSYGIGPRAPTLRFSYSHMASRVRNSVLMPNIRRIAKYSDMLNTLTHARALHTKSASLFVTDADKAAAARVVAQAESPAVYQQLAEQHVLGRVISHTRRTPLMAPWAIPLRDLSSHGAVATATLCWALSSMQLGPKTSPDAFVDRLHFMPANGDMIPRGSSFWALVGVDDASMTGNNWPKDPFKVMQSRVASATRGPSAPSDDLSDVFKTNAQFQAAVRHLVYDQYRSFD